MTLDQAKKGSKVCILAIKSPEHRTQLVRMGISEGSIVTCQEKLPMGPVVLRCNRQEIAVGRQLARGITVRQHCHSEQSEEPACRPEILRFAQNDNVP